SRAGSLEEALKVWRFGIFGVLSFVYAISLAYFPRLHLSWIAGTCLHVVARNLFSLGTILLFLQPGRLGRAVMGLQVGLLLATTLWATIAPETLMLFYRWE